MQLYGNRLRSPEEVYLIRCSKQGLLPVIAFKGLAEFLVRHFWQQISPRQEGVKVLIGGQNHMLWVPVGLTSMFLVQVFLESLQGGDSYEYPQQNLLRRSKHTHPFIMIPQLQMWNSNEDNLMIIFHLFSQEVHCGYLEFP